jgi:DNA-binding GntR family transcriptional regulator
VERNVEIKENPSMYQQIFLALQQQILHGEIPEGRRIPTEKELMQQYATSRITASRAVRELENMGYVKRIKAKGT